MCSGRGRDQHASMPLEETRHTTVGFADTQALANKREQPRQMTAYMYETGSPTFAPDDESSPSASSGCGTAYHTQHAQQQQ